MNPSPAWPARPSAPPPHLATLLPQLSRGARLALAALAGVLNGVGFVFWGPMALFANLPLLLALHGAPTRRQAALLGLTTGFLGGCHIYGIVDYGWLLMAGFALYTGSQMVLFALALRALWGRLSPWVDLALPALIWSLTEHLRTLGPLAMPASYVGCIAESEVLRPWLWLAPFTGGLGVSTLVALVPSVLFHGWLGGRHRRAAWAFGLLLLGAGVLGHRLPPALGDRPLQVVGVQGGLANTQYRAAFADARAMRDIVDTYAALSRRAYDLGADLVVWPETAVRAPVLHTPALRARLFPGVGDRSHLVAGLLHREGSQAWNLAVAVGPGVEGGVELARYAKVRTVPRTEDYLTRGAAWVPLPTPIGRLGPIICLESVYPEAARTMVAAGAEILLVQSNDAGFGRSPITGHMTARAVVRAVENGRWLLRVGQAGITTLIDPRGIKHGQLGLFEPGLLQGEARLRDDLTPFTRYGNWWAALCLGLVLVIAALSRRRRRPDAGPPTDAAAPG